MSVVVSLSHRDPITLINNVYIEEYDDSSVTRNKTNAVISDVQIINLTDDENITVPVERFIEYEGELVKSSDIAVVDVAPVKETRFTKFKNFIKKASSYLYRNIICPIGIGIITAVIAAIIIAAVLA